MPEQPLSSELPEQSLATEPVPLASETAVAPSSDASLAPSSNAAPLAPAPVENPSTFHKAKSTITNFFSSMKWPGSGGRRRRRGGIGSPWNSKSHPLYLNPSANAQGDNIYNLKKGGSSEVVPYETLKSTHANSESAYLLGGKRSRRRKRSGKSSKKSRKTRKVRKTRRVRK